MGTPKPGDRAPDFALPDQTGKQVALHDFLGKKNVVLYFYPKDFTMGCTAETRAFGETYEDLIKLGAEVIGVSSDSAESHGSFAQHCDTRFPLLSDGDGKVRAEYGAKSSFGLLPGRVTFVIDKEGVVRDVYSSQLHPKQHVAEALGVLKSIQG